MVADKGKKPKIGEKIVKENDEQIDDELILSIEKLQEVQDELEKVLNLVVVVVVVIYRFFMLLILKKKTISATFIIFTYVHLSEIWQFWT